MGMELKLSILDPFHLHVIHNPISFRDYILMPMSATCKRPCVEKNFERFNNSLIKLKASTPDDGVIIITLTQYMHENVKNRC